MTEKRKRFLLRMGQPFRLQDSLLSLKSFSLEDGEVKQALLEIYDFSLERRRQVWLALGDQLLIPPLSYQVTSLEIRKTADERPLEECFLLELETPAS